jgi:hypothetical protein
MGQMAADTNQSITLFGESVMHFFRDQQRSAMTSPLFNLPGRLVLGSHCYYENLPQLLSEIRDHASEEDIGRGMKRLCTRPNYVHLNSLALGFLVGREQARLSGVDTGGDGEGVASVMEFWSRVARSYRNDGLLLPDQADFTVPILPAETISDLNGHLGGDFPDQLRRQNHRMVATLELYTFILHGEARVGVVHHGPYPLNGGDGHSGDTLVVKELVGLKEDFYPWAQLETRLPYDNIACVMRLRDVHSKIVLFGTLTTEPRDYAPSIVAEALFVVENGAYRPLPADEIPELTQLAADAQLELYRRVIDWDDKYRIEYGADLYGYLLKSFADQLGFGEAFGHKIRACFSESIDRHLENLYSGDERPRVLEHIATTAGPIFSPLSDEGARNP